MLSKTYWLFLLVGIVPMIDLFEQLSLPHIQFPLPPVHSPWTIRSRCQRWFSFCCCCWCHQWWRGRSFWRIMFVLPHDCLFTLFTFFTFSSLLVKMTPHFWCRSWKWDHLDDHCIYHCWLFVFIINATERRVQQCTRPNHNKTAVDLAKLVNSHLRFAYGNIFDLTEAQVSL